MFYLEFRPMNEQDMLDYLGELEDLEEQIPLMLQSVYKKCESKEECIYRNMFQSTGSDNCGRDKYRNGDPVYCTLMAVRRDMARQDRAVEQQIKRIRSWQDKLDHVKFCLFQLPREQREILIDLCVKKESRKAYAARNCLSGATAGRRRKEALEELMQHYNKRFTRERQEERRT